MKNTTKEQIREQILATDRLNMNLRFLRGDVNNVSEFQAASELCDVEIKPPPPISPLSALCSHF